MAHCTGWILDVSLEQNRAINWIKTTEGNVLKLLDAYYSNFYILPKEESLFQILSQEPIVTKVKWVQKFTDLFDATSQGTRRLLSVCTKSTLAQKTLVKRLEKDQRVAQLFDTDLSPVQQYLFKRLKIEPASKAEVEYDETTFRLIGITNIEEDTCTPPPFSILYFDIRDLDNNQIRQIEARYEGEQDVSFEGEGESMLSKFYEYVVNKDPDILVRDNYNSIFKHLMTKMNALGFDIGREPSKATVKGRICLESKSFHTNLDLAGLIERARFGFFH